MIRSLRPLFAWLGLCIGVIALSQAKIEEKFKWPYPSLDELVVSEHYMEDLSALLLGSHRLSADLAYIQFLQYYGVPEVPETEEEHSVAGHKHRDFAAGSYPRLKEMATRYLRLDPFFSKAILESAGSLAFNQVRINESLDLLNEAIRRNPSYYRYHLYLSAILYKNTGQEGKLIDKLLEAIQYPDCPVMLEAVLGNLLRKYNRFDEAARVYLHIVDTAANEGDRNMAVEKLQSLLREHPETIKAVGNHPIFN